MNILIAPTHLHTAHNRLARLRATLWGWGWGTAGAIVKNQHVLYGNINIYDLVALTKIGSCSRAPPCGDGGGAWGELERSTWASFKKNN